MTNKICNKCGSRVDSSVKFCPKCRSTSFRNVYEIAKPNNSLIYRVFYNYENRYFILSKSKVAAVLVFLLFMTLVFDSPTIIFFAVVVAALVYVIGNSVHKILGKDEIPRIVFENNDSGLINDLKHLFFYWQDCETGEFEFSKTKAITVLVFLLFTSMGAIFGATSMFAMALFGLMIATPTFFVGYGIHKLTAADPVKELMDKTQSAAGKRQVKARPKSNVHEFDAYRRRLNELKAMYEVKEKNARRLVERRFTPPQLTYDRFMLSIENSNRMFKQNADALSNILDLASEDSKKIEEEIKSRMDVLESLVDKMDHLVNELVLSLNEDNDTGNHTSFLHDFDYIIDSVKDY